MVHFKHQGIPFRRWVILCLTMAAFSVSLAHHTNAQADLKGKSPASAKLRQAYEISLRADTEAELTKVLKLCEAASTDDDPSSATNRYGRKLRLWALEARSELLIDAGHAAQALADLDEALRLDPLQVSALRKRGACLASLGRHDEAFVDLDRAIELRHGDARSYVDRGEVNYAVGRYEAAARDYDQAVRLKPNDARALVGRGHAQYRLGRISTAVKDYSQAIRMRPQDAKLLTQRGNAYADMGRYTEAADDFRQAMRIDPNHGRAFQSAAWLMSTCPDPRYRDKILAMELAKRAIDLDGKSNHRYLETLAAALANAGYHDEAKQVQERALQRAPEKAISSSEQKLGQFAAGRPYREGKLRR